MREDAVELGSGWGWLACLGWELSALSNWGGRNLKTLFRLVWSRHADAFSSSLITTFFTLVFCQPASALFTFHVHGMCSMLSALWSWARSDVSLYAL
jgi:hypothetical protein